MKLSRCFVLIVGSASADADAAELAKASEFVRKVTRALLAEGAGVVVFTGAPEPTTSTGQPRIFDWVVLEEVERTLGLDGCRAIAVTSTKVRSRMPADRGALLERLVQRGVMRLIEVPDETHTGGNIGDAQARNANALIAIGGGKGVADRAAKIIERGGTVLPVNASIGAANEDGTGSVGLHQHAISNPKRFAPHAPESLAAALGQLNLHGSVDLAVAATVSALTAEWVARNAARRPDVLVLTALPVELGAALRALSVSDEPQKTTMGTNFWLVDTEPTRGSPAPRLAVACLGGAGNVSAAVIATELVQRFQPAFVVMVGIAAGIRGKCRIGDVVLSERVVAYESAAVVAVQGFISGIFKLFGVTRRVEQRRPEMYRLGHAIEQDVVAYLSALETVVDRVKAAMSALGMELPAGPDVVKAVSPRLATIASGEKLLRDPSVLRGLQENVHGKIEVGEMEAAGIAEACRRHKIDFLIVRGISDFGDTKKTDNAHHLASVGAAVVAADFIRYGLVIGTPKST